jgi:hypothetical protein
VNVISLVVSCPYGPICDERTIPVSQVPDSPRPASHWRLPKGTVGSTRPKGFKGTGPAGGCSWRGKDALYRSLRYAGLSICWRQPTCHYSISPSAQDAAVGLSPRSTGVLESENMVAIARAGLSRRPSVPRKKACKGSCQGAKDPQIPADARAINVA